MSAVTRRGFVKNRAMTTTTTIGAAELGVCHHPATSASVALDIGTGSGALVIYPDERFRGAEIEISPVSGDGRRVHTGVHERTTQAGSMLTAVFGSLPAGEYVVCDTDTRAGVAIVVREGAVTEIHLP